MLPETLKPYFWDCDFDSLDLFLHRKFIVERILIYGNSPAVHWLLAAISEKELQEIVTEGKKLDPKTLNYWRLWFEHRTDH